MPRKKQSESFIDAILAAGGGSGVSPTLPATKGDDSPLEGLPAPVLKWLRGKVSEEPPEVAKMMDSISKRINISLAYILVNRLSSLNRIIEFMSKVESDTVDPEEYAKLEPHQRFAVYQHFDKTVSTFMDFVRKFVVQNSSTFEHSQPADELAVLLRTVDPAILKRLVSVLRAKGAALTDNDFAEFGKSVSQEGDFSKLVE